MVVFDSTVLLLALDPDVRSPIDPDTGKPVERPKDRTNSLLEEISGKDDEQIGIPIPVLTEVPTASGDALKARLAWVKERDIFQIMDFTGMAAIDAASPTYRELANRERGDDRVRIKFDQPVVAIARTTKATAINSDDRPLRNPANRQNVRVIQTWRIDLPD